MLAAILGAIAAIPRLADLMEKLIAAISEAWLEAKKKQASDQFQKGAEIAQKEKNTCELEKAWNPDKKCD